MSFDSEFLALSTLTCDGLLALNTSDLLVCFNCNEASAVFLSKSNLDEFLMSGLHCRFCSICVTMVTIRDKIFINIFVVTSH